MKIIIINFLLVLIFNNKTQGSLQEDNTEQCTLENRPKCEGSGHIEEELGEKTINRHRVEIYQKDSNEIYMKIQKALKNYKPCTEITNDPDCLCHAEVILSDLEPYQKDGITEEMIKESGKYGTHYKVYNHRLYRDVDCMFPARCGGIEHFLLQLLPELPDLDLIINTRDWPQLRSVFGKNGAVFSFSKTADYSDIMYPAWTFWAGGPAITLHPTGIGRWDLLRENITKAAREWTWKEKKPIGFFRGSRTSDERDSLVLLSRHSANLVDAQYTKNQAWKSSKDTLNAEPAKEVSFEDHCRFRYLFNFRGVAASFRLKHLFLCKSLVFHVGNEWNEFFYYALKPWVHYVPLNSYPNEKDIKDLLVFFQQHDDLAQQIAQRGFDFIWNHLRMQDVKCYWLKLLLQYEKLLKYKIVKDEDMIEIKYKKK